MATETQTLYDRLGGQAVIEAVVERFYQRILADPGIAHYFARLDMDQQRKHQTAFISEVLGGPKLYQGRTMHEAHAGLNLKGSDFDAVASHLVAALEAFKVRQVDIDTVMSNITLLERDILEH